MARHRVKSRFHNNKKVINLLVVYVTLLLAPIPTNHNPSITTRVWASLWQDTFDNKNPIAVIVSVKDKAKLCLLRTVTYLLYISTPV